VKKFVHMRFEPSGYTSHPNIRYAKSLMDYIFRWTALKFLSREEQMEVGVNLDIEETITSYVEKETGSEPQTVKAIPIVENNALESPPGGEVTAIRSEAPVATIEMKTETKNSKVAFQNSEDSPMCHFCGAIMIRNGACYKCLNCGTTSGCS